MCNWLQEKLPLRTFFLFLAMMFHWSDPHEQQMLHTHFLFALLFHRNIPTLPWRICWFHSSPPANTLLPLLILGLAHAFIKTFWLLELHLPLKLLITLLGMGYFLGTNITELYCSISRIVQISYNSWLALSRNKNIIWKPVSGKS